MRFQCVWRTAENPFATAQTPETARKIIGAGLDRMKISFYGTDEESYNNTMNRLDLNVTLHNYGGGRSYNPMGREIVSVCYFPWISMSLLWDGRVVTCCMDSNGVQVLGDLNNQTVREVWNGPVLAGVRRDFANLDYGKYPVCTTCDWVRRH